MAHSYYNQESHGPYQTLDLGPFVLDNGDTIRNLALAYATFGSLSPAKDNAILFPTWYSGTSKILEQAYIGPGRALDPERYFIILVNQIGNGLSSAPHNQPSPFNAARFPRVSISDDVRAQYRLVTEHFGIERLQLVLGGSMGAQQTYEWAVRYPEQVLRAAPIAGTARASVHNRLVVEGLIAAIASDPAFDNGWYAEPGLVHRGLRRHAQLFATKVFSSRLFEQEGWRALGFSSVDDFLSGFVEQHFLQQDPNNLILLARKWQDSDVSRNTSGDLKKALSHITATTFVVAVDEDDLFPLADIVAEQTLVPQSHLKRLSSPWGHLAIFGLDQAYRDNIDSVLKELLATP
ncbi:alpha/beta fold hydrolase [Beijerinckia indica]|uniref:Alpha/beta hydrolase fold n=1 Tax=Beijerinckia indica subsp. indica (strain ATCC 9039 / DSM 1715 / NCIMB 8712) TaxID=395963 RepID=B2IJR9_BEII9|nr:alpha/beta fold hydrolase [Beijerinckia indica]ACB94941.1 alpha/beta hydrolase fold [Beijerinckia indica subsp. indica ATCC 9039]